MNDLHKFVTTLALEDGIPWSYMKHDYEVVTVHRGGCGRDRHRGRRRRPPPHPEIHQT
jgi:hypothetical protein